MIRWLKAWWKARGERRCVAGKHLWKPSSPPLEKFGHGSSFAANFYMSMYYSWATCRRCGVTGRKLPSS